MTQKKEWVIFDTNRCFSEETFESAKEAVDYALDCYDAKRTGKSAEMFENADEDATFWVGYKAEYEPQIDTDWVIERLGEDVFDFTAGSEDAWLETINDEQKADFDQRLQKALKGWLDDNGLQPNFWIAQDLTDYDAYEILAVRWETAGLEAPYDPPKNSR